MIEFKFSCPNCSQHISCNDSYSGMQIVCPTCKNQIVVPQAPMVAPPARSATPPPPPTDPQAAAPPAALPPRLDAKKSSKAKLIAICGAVALLFIGAIAYVFLSSAYSDSDEGLTGETAVRPAVAKPAPRKISEPAASDDEPSPSYSEPSQVISETPRSINTEAPSAGEIVKKITEKYDSLTSYSASGTAVSIIDMSGMDTKNIPGMSDKIPQSVRDSKEFKERFSKPQKTESEFSVKLGKPDFYLVEWQGQMGPAKTKGAVWSSGDGDFILMDMGKTKYMKMQNRDLALASATGLSGGAANTMPQIFFKGNASLLDMFKNPTRHDDEPLDGSDCYVLSGVTMGMKMILWIDKESFLIKQKQQVLGGDVDLPDVTEEQIQDAVKQLGDKASKEQEAQIRASLKNMKAMTSQMKGSITETYRNIEINRPTKNSDFDHEVPTGTELSKSLF